MNTTLSANQNNLSIGDVAEMLEIPPHTIRYWEKEFNEFLRPQRNQGKQRKYTEYDINLLKRIKRMLRDEKYSIAGAKQKLAQFFSEEQIGEQQILMQKIMDFIKTNNLIQTEERVENHV